jgi:hypothetical protein
MTSLPRTPVGKGEMNDGLLGVQAAAAVASQAAAATPSAEAASDRARIVALEGAVSEMLQLLRAERQVPAAPAAPAAAGAAAAEPAARSPTQGDFGVSSDELEECDLAEITNSNVATLLPAVAAAAQAMAAGGVGARVAAVPAGGLRVPVHIADLPSCPLLEHHTKDRLGSPGGWCWWSMRRMRWS